MDKPESISYEVFELYKKVIDHANKYDALFRDIERKTKAFDDVIFSFETFARSVKDQLAVFIDKTRFEIDKSLEIYQLERSKVADFLNEAEKIRKLQAVAENLVSTLEILRVDYQHVYNQANESYQKFQNLLNSIETQSNKYLNQTITELSDKIDKEINSKVARDLKTIETQILLRHKILEGRVVELSNMLNLLFASIEGTNKNNESDKVNFSESSDVANSFKTIDKVTQKHLNITSEMELKLDQITESMKDFEAKLSKEKKEISKLYEDLLEKDSNDFNKLKDRIYNLSFEIEKNQKEVEKAQRNSVISIIIAFVAVLVSVLVSFLI
jgi:chromosome segregation ATPase